MSIDTEQQVKHWLNNFVIKLNLCPFAAPVVRDNRLRLFVSSEKKNKVIAQQLMDELDYLQKADASTVSTTLFIIENALKDFYAYLDFLSVAQAMLEEMELEGIIQLASFHPDYLFEGEAADDISHYTNRAPFPIIHLIREDELSEAISRYPNVDEVPQRNIEQLHDLGLEKILQLLTHNDNN